MKRFLSILLCSAILAAAIPGMYYAEGNQSSYDELSQLKEIDYQLNGGHYVSGYNAPDKYPAEQLPDKNDIVNQGYEFGGWYDNKELPEKDWQSLSQSEPAYSYSPPSAQTPDPDSYSWISESSSDSPPHYSINNPYVPSFQTAVLFIFYISNIEICQLHYCSLRSL